MDFEINEEQRMLRDAIREFAVKEIIPVVAEHERESRFPAELVKRLWSELGLGGMRAPEEYGGIDLDSVSYIVVIEELARVWASLAIIVSVHNSVAVHLIGLYAVFERGCVPSRATRVVQRAANQKLEYVWLDPPSSRGTATIVDAHHAVDPGEHAERIERWAKSVWNAWQLHHPTVRRWAERCFHSAAASS